jgi:PhnB protein
LHRIEIQKEEELMATKAKPIPDDYRAATPYLCVDGAARAIEFYKKAFGAKEVMRMGDPSGKIGHAEIRIREAPIMLADEFPEMGARAPRSIGGSPVGIQVYFEDVDAVAKKAVAAGAKILRPVEDQFYGDRTGKLEDPFGHIWWIATRKENLSVEEMKKRAAAMFGKA